DADAFAGLLEARPISTQRRTSISAAIAEGAAELVSNNFQGMRQVIDVSGDGPNNIGEPVSAVRSKAVEAGITINGLAIMLRPSWNSGALDQYYGDCVIGGPGSFVLPVHDVDDFATAIRRKLVLEISGKPPSAPMQNAAAEAADCMIGERQWQHFLDR
ncbi:MAG TPA: DUF1194 domain-containing protein, partial [Pseudorhizobium sp.]|nr:DUF1194 domain-containing protein [Pseudorhizobium sp.]